MKIRYPEFLTLAHIPTPVEKLDYFERSRNITLFIKRDDLTECGASGNKVRKLEFLLADARDKGADTIITCGGVQSNHARATAILSARLGLKSLLLLRGEEPPEADGNLFLDRLLGASIRYITGEQWIYRDSIMSEIAEELKEKGHNSYVIPEGGSNGLGSIGYIRAVDEIRRQLKKESTKIDYIVNATGSGGTQAGLIMGCRLYLRGTRVAGFNVCDNEDYFRKKIGEIIREVEGRLEIDFSIHNDEITIIEGYSGRGYGISSPDELSLINDVASHTGIILDPVYTGKAFKGLSDEIRKGRFKKGTSILFLHSGGIFGLFPKKSEFRFS